MMGININCKEQDFIGQILSGEKTVETRNAHSLRCYVGQRVGLVKTGTGKAVLVGYATISEEILYGSESEFREAYSEHRVEAGSKYDIKSEKYGYRLTDVEPTEPTTIESKGIIARRIS